MRLPVATARSGPPRAARRRSARAAAAGGALLLSLLGAAPPPAAPPPAAPAAPKPACALGARDTRWLRRAFAAWALVRRDELGLPAAAPPTLLLFDARCVYHVAPAAPPAGRGAKPGLELDGVRVQAAGAPHGGVVRLPDGRQIEPAPLAFTSLHQRDSVPFVVMALESVWSDAPDAALTADGWQDYLPGALVHELVHTRQLAALARRLGPLQQYFAVPVLDDDMVQQRFGGEREFRSSVERERDLLLEAGTVGDRAARRRSAERALRLVQARRARWYTSTAEPYAELEDAFLDMEGVAQWAAFCVARQAAPAGTAVPKLVAEFRAGEQWWSQDEGLALYLALDALVPGWARRVFAPDAPTGLALLAEAVGAGPDATAAR
jgi:hypothetical protein